MNSEYCFQLYFDKVCVASFPLYELWEKLFEIIENE